MRIGVLSDTHSRYATVEKALQMLQERRVNFVIHCGDIDDSETIWLFQGFTAHFTFGNCDWDKTSLQQAIHGIGETLHERWGYLELEGVKMAFTHGDDARTLRELEQSGAFDYLFHGHTHVAADRRTGKTRVINPGALHRARVKTFVILDLESGEVESVVVE
jgi:hypothetical protein